MGSSGTPWVAALRHSRRPFTRPPRDGGAAGQEAGRRRGRRARLRGHRDRVVATQPPSHPPPPLPRMLLRPPPILRGSSTPPHPSWGDPFPSLPPHPPHPHHKQPRRRPLAQADGVPGGPPRGLRPGEQSVACHVWSRRRLLLWQSTRPPSAAVPLGPQLTAKRREGGAAALGARLLGGGLGARAPCPPPQPPLLAPRGC